MFCVLKSGESKLVAQIFRHAREYLITTIKKMDYKLNPQNYFYVTYVMHYMIITYFYSLRIFLCKGGLYQNCEYVKQGRTSASSLGKGPSQSTRPERLYIADTYKHFSRIFLCNLLPIIYI